MTLGEGRDAERAQRLLAGHDRHADRRLDATADGPGKGPRGLLVVLDDGRLLAREGLAQGTVADLDPLPHGVSDRDAGEQSEAVGRRVPPAQGGALRLQKLAGAVDDQAAQLGQVAETTGRDRDLVQGPEAVRLLNRLLGEPGRLEGGGDLGRQEHQEVFLFGRPVPRPTVEDAEGANRSVRDHQRHREAALDAPKDRRWHRLRPRAVVINPHRLPVREGPARRALTGFEGRFQ